MPEAARLLDQVTHTSALAGLIVGAVAGAVIGAVVVASGGTAAVALGTLAVGACAGASLGGMICELVGSLITFKTGPIAAPGAMMVLIDGRPAARVTDLVACTGMPFTPIPHPGVPIAQGSTTVMIGGLPAARKGDMVGCGAQIAEGSSTVLIGGPTGTYLPIDSEVPWYLEVGLTALGLVGGIGAIALAGKGLRVLAAARLVGSLAGGWGMGQGGKWLGGKIFGEGSTGQKVFALAGSVGGSMLGARVAGRFFPSAQQLVETQRQTLLQQPGKKPTAVSVALDRLTGKSYPGTSGRPYPETIAPELANKMPSESLEKWPVENCAEFKATNNALLDGAKPENLEVHTVVTKTGEAFPRCDNCKLTTDGILTTSDP